MCHATRLNGASLPGQLTIANGNRFGTSPGYLL